MKPNSSWPCLPPHACAVGHDFVPILVHEEKKGKYVTLYCRKCGMPTEWKRASDAE